MLPMISQNRQFDLDTDIDAYRDDNPNYFDNSNNSTNANMNLNSNNFLKDSNSMGRRPRRVTFYKNGDKYFNGKLVTISPNRFYSFKDLMNDLNRSVDLPYGVRRVYTPVSGREIYDIDELVDGSSYVCASFEPFRQAKYGEAHDRQWNSNNGESGNFFFFLIKLNCLVSGLIYLEI